MKERRSESQLILTTIFLIFCPVVQNHSYKRTVTFYSFVYLFILLIDLRWESFGFGLTGFRAFFRQPIPDEWFTGLLFLLRPQSNKKNKSFVSFFC